VASDYLRGMRTGRLEVINGVRSIFEDSEQRLSILTILAFLDRMEHEIEDAIAKQDSGEGE